MNVKFKRNLSDKAITSGFFCLSLFCEPSQIRLTQLNMFKINHDLIQCVDPANLRRERQWFPKHAKGPGFNPLTSSTLKISIHHCRPGQDEMAKWPDPALGSFLPSYLMERMLWSFTAWALAQTKKWKSEGIFLARLLCHFKNVYSTY